MGNENVQEQRGSLSEARKVGVTLKHFGQNVTFTPQTLPTDTMSSLRTLRSQNKGTPMSFGFHNARRINSRAKNESWNGSYFNAWRNAEEKCSRNHSKTAAIGHLIYLNEWLQEYRQLVVRS